VEAEGLAGARAMQGADEQGPARCWAPPLDGEEARGSWPARDYELARRELAIWPDALIAGIWPDARSGRTR
jgi:hypothetical protein